MNVEEQWLKHAATATADTNDATHGVYFAHLDGNVQQSKTISGTFPLQSESPNSYAMMRHCMNISM